MALISNTSPTVQKMLREVAKLPNNDIRQLVSEANSILAQRQVPNLSQRESELLARIDEIVKPEIYEQYQHLRDKMVQHVIDEREHEELLHLTEIMEVAQVERLQYLVELAQLRKTSLQDLMNQFGIETPPRQYVQTF